MLLILLLMVTVVPFQTTFSAILSCLSNTGASIAGVAKNYALITDPGKWILMFAMLAGRLEIMTLLVFFVPEFWRN